MLLCCACSAVRTLDSESGLYDVKLERHGKLLVDGGWTWGGGNPYAKQKDVSLFISPLDISKVKEAQPELAPLMVTQMHELMVQDLSKALAESNAANGTRWRLVDAAQGATLRVDMALVHLRPQRPTLRLLSSVGGLFVKVPGVSDAVGSFAKGDICIELTVRDAKTNRLLLACKDSNPKTARLISASAYSKHGHADVSMRFWAERFARLVRMCAYDQLGDRTLQEVIRERSWSEVAKDRVLR